MGNESIDVILSRLRDPLERERAVVELSLLGVDAIGPLVSFILAGPGNEHEPGCLATEALELIGGEEALDGLFTSLLEPIALRDLVEELQHEAVRDCICHALQRLGDRRAVTLSSWLFANIVSWALLKRWLVLVSDGPSLFSWRFLRTVSRERGSRRPY